jgi:hypothetical protein
MLFAVGTVCVVWSTEELSRGILRILNLIKEELFDGMRPLVAVCSLELPPRTLSTFLTTSVSSFQ